MSAIDWPHVRPDWLGTAYAAEKCAEELVHGPLVDNVRAVGEDWLRIQESVRIIRLAMHAEDDERATKMIDALAASMGIT